MVVALVVVELVKVRLVPARPAKNPLVKLSPVPERLVVEALVAVRPAMKALVKVSPVPERLVVEALVEKSLVTVPTVVEELLKYA